MITNLDQTIKLFGFLCKCFYATAVNDLSLANSYFTIKIFVSLQTATSTELSSVLSGCAIFNLFLLKHKKMTMLWKCDEQIDHSFVHKANKNPTIYDFWMHECSFSLAIAFVPFGFVHLEVVKSFRCGKIGHPLHWGECFSCVFFFRILIVNKNSKMLCNFAFATLLQKNAFVLLQRQRNRHKSQY